MSEDMWQALFRKESPALTRALTLDRVLVNRAADKMQVRFHAARLLSDGEFRALEKDLRAGFPKARVTLKVAYPRLREEVTRDIAPYARYVSGLVVGEFPGAMPYLVWDEAAWKLEGDKLRIFVADEMGAEYLRARQIAERVEKWMDELFAIPCHAQVEVRGDEERHIREIADKRAKDEARMLEEHAETLKRAQANQKPAKPKQILGKTIADNDIPIEELTEDAGNVTLKGEILRFELRDLKNGSMKLMSFALTDYTGSVACKAFLGSRRRSEEAEEMQKQADIANEAMKPGQWVKVRGEYRFDDFQREMVLMASDIQLVEAQKRQDDAPEKRVELHLHTQMSAMDACIAPEAAIARAAEWGHKAVAITDHGVVQAFPDAFSAAKKRGVKLIPGLEGYLIEDCARVVKGADERMIDDCPFVVFDVETTGLSAGRDEIIEIGAVRIENGCEVGEFSTLIDPRRPIPEKITEITGINDAMVAGMPTIEQAARDFAAFIEGAALAAHNADFDMGFMDRAFQKAGLPFSHPALDTLLFARNALPKLKSYKLGAVCKHYGVSLKNAHRAVHDARATGQVLMRLLKEARSAAPVRTLADLNGLYKQNEGGASYHIILLAATQPGMANLYRLVSEAHLHHFHRTPRLPRSLIAQYREGLIIGSACEAGELFRAVAAGRPEAELLEIARFYDYLEIQPLGNNEFMLREGAVKSETELENFNRKIVELADKLGIPCVATGDVHFMEPQDASYRAVMMAAKGFEDADNQAPLYFRTTAEMLKEFEYLGAETARRVVIEAPNEIADRIGELRVFVEHPEKKSTFQPFWPDAEADIRDRVDRTAHAIYGENLPEIVQARIDKELHSIIGYGFSTLYDIAVKLVEKSLSDGYIVGSRGSVGSSFVAFLTGITEVNALPPHYVCPACKRVEFDVPKEYTCGLDLPDKDCPDCGSRMLRDGYNIPFEVFLGFKGDKVPDIDLNFSGEYQPVAHAYVKELFGAENVFRAGTIGTIAEKTAYGYVLKYLEERGKSATNAEKERLAMGMTGVKRTTGQHPAGMVVLPKDYEIYQFTPIQHPADDLESETITTHFDFSSMHDVLVKLDILGHDDPTMLRRLQDLTGIAPQKVPLEDHQVFDEILSLFTSPKALGLTSEQLGVKTGTLGVPEFGTSFVRQMLMDTRPSSMEELIRISGLSHGTDVWLGNTQDIVKGGIAPLRNCICTRDDIMNQLIGLGVPDKIAFDTMESVRKGKGLKPEMEASMREHGTPDWFIDSCKKIGYMFPKAHAVAYVTMALRIAYFKIYYPVQYYSCYLHRNAEAFDAQTMIGGVETLKARLEELESLDKDERAKKEDEITVLESVIEMRLRGIELSNVSVYDSDPEKFLIIEGNCILPPLTSLPGVGLQAALQLQKSREGQPFLSQEDMLRRKVPKSVIEALKANGCINGLPESSQVSLFDM